VQTIRAITLDLDDTLWPIRPVLERAERCLREWLDERYPNIMPRFPPAAIEALRRRIVNQHRARAHDLRFLRQETLRQMAFVAGYDDFDLDGAFDSFDAARNAVELFPDVRPALLALRRHYRLVAVTNGSASLERIGIDDLFDGYVNARLAGAAKPERPIFDAALCVAGTAPGETLHIGDQPLSDVEGARSAGIDAVWINRENREWPEELPAPRRTVRDLHELADLLADARGTVA